MRSICFGITAVKRYYHWDFIFYTNSSPAHRFITAVANSFLPCTLLTTHHKHVPPSSSVCHSRQGRLLPTPRRLSLEGQECSRHRRGIRLGSSVCEGIRRGRVCANTLGAGCEDFSRQSVAHVLIRRYGRAYVTIGDIQAELGQKYAEELKAEGFQ